MSAEMSTEIECLRTEALRLWRLGWFCWGVAAGIPLGAIIYRVALL